MYVGYNLRDVESTYFSAYYDLGLLAHRTSNKIARNSLEAIVNGDGSIFASKIADDWFPGVSADVFISHAHKDSRIAIGLAGWLKDKFGLSAFIDSCVWGHSEDLLRILDKRYCWQRETETYNYDKRNKTTSHVHAILSAALTSMIDECECVIFLNTPSSISCEGYVTKEGTESPWIYSELATTRIIKKHCPRSRLSRKSEARVFDEALNIKYDSDLSHLIKMDKSDLQKWLHKNQHSGPRALDALYDITDR